MKIIGSDFDGTILNNREILDSTRKQIQAFREQGNLFVIVTGRSPKTFIEAIPYYQIDFFDYAICANGAVVFDQMLRPLRTQTIHQSHALQLVEQLLDAYENIYIGVNTLENNIVIQSREDIPNIDDDVVSIALAFETVEQRISFDIKFDDVDIFCNHRYMDIVPKGVSKAVVLSDLFKGLHGKELYTIGDGENDICMLECTNNSFTFHHVDGIVKNSANHIMHHIDDVLRKINLNV